MGLFEYTDGSIPMSSPYIPFEKTPRVISLKRDEGTYTAQIWPIDEDQKFKGRVIILRNPYEDVVMYRRTIDMLAMSGYETFYYTSWLEKFEEEEMMRKEINRIVRMCVDDLDAQPGLSGLNVHMLGSHYTGAQALLYGIDGSYRYRLKTIIAVNPLVMPTSVFRAKSFGMGLRMKVKMKPKSSSDLLINPELFTADPEWITYLKEKQLRHKQSFYTNLHLQNILSLNADLSNKNKSRKFDMKHLLVVCSNEDALANADATKEFINNTGAQQAFFLEYDHGLSNLFVERERVYHKLITDLVMWLDEN
ncbi:Monoglyceride lipase [Cyberlindnera fabianii]|uniref:Monoglyceride lipase n=1 Tax=Cyberlindnera fabianii TaxID=36022 RepID=A0A1V2LD45_CYBFA|nr:Monoglyceride lipase [Cyberlindnera fabianii]